MYLSENEYLSFGSIIPDSCTFKCENFNLAFWAGSHHQTNSYIQSPPRHKLAMQGKPAPEKKQVNVVRMFFLEIKWVVSMQTVNKWRIRATEEMIHKDKWLYLPILHSTNSRKGNLSLDYRVTRLGRIPLSFKRQTSKRIWIHLQMGTSA